MSTNEQARVTHAEASQALDSMDDYARMETGVDAHWPREVLERYIAQQAETLRQSDDSGRVGGEDRPLAGRWHHGNGALCCGIFRVARADWEADVCASEGMRDQVLDWIVARLNAPALAAQGQGEAPFGWVNVIGELSASKKNSDDVAVYLRPAPEPAAQGDAVAWLHTVTQGDGETDQALSFSPDSFPLDTQLGFRSLGSVPLYTHPAPVASPAGVPDSCRTPEFVKWLREMAWEMHMDPMDCCGPRANHTIAYALDDLADAIAAAAPSAPEGDDHE